MKVRIEIVFALSHSYPVIYYSNIVIHISVAPWGGPEKVDLAGGSGRGGWVTAFNRFQYSQQNGAGGTFLFEA